MVATEVTLKLSSSVNVDSNDDTQKFNYIEQVKQENFQVDLQDYY